MPIGLITLPLRLGLRVAGLVLRPVASALGLTDHEDDVRVAAVPQEPPRRPTRVPPRPRREPTARADIPDEPTHVSEEPVVVAEVADPGAEDGAGAQVSVAEPWDGYRKMKAGEIIARLESATPEEVAVVQLYEGMNRRRKTVLEAAGYSQRK
jgi:hypothetical protein